MEAQRVTTRGPNPNPTAQAQSKRCLPLSTKTQKIIENALLRAPIFSVFRYLFRLFSSKLFAGIRGTPKSLEMTLKCYSKVPKMTSIGAKLEPRDPPKV